MKIFFWKGVIVPPDIEDRCSEELKQLSLGHYKSLALEKLAVPGEKIYSIRVNRADRLILTEHDGILIVLQYVDNHAYDKSKFLEKGGLRRYLTSKRANLDEVIAAGFKAIENEEELAHITAHGDKDIATWQEIERHDGRWIQLTDQQRDGLYIQLPAIVKGHAGAGKSTLALSMLLNDLQMQEADTPRVYLSKSPTLVREMYKRWHEIGLEEDAWRDKVLFLTYEELLQRFFLGPYVGPDITWVKPEAFYTWMTKYIKKNPWTPPQESSHGKANGATALVDAELSLLWEEVQKCAGFETIAEYYALGQRQSELTDRKNREYVAKTYHHYIEHLSSLHQISPELFVARGVVEPFFSLIMVDEAQNLSPAALVVMQRLAIHNNIIFFAGDQQVLNSRRPNLPYIRARYHEQGIQITELNLRQTHRCPKRVVQLVNELTRLKRLVAGGISDKHEQDNMEAFDGAIEGEVVWSTIEEMNLPLLQKRAQHTGFAVVTTADHRDAIRHLFPAGVVVFSVDEAQGLDIPDLFVFNVFDEGICSQIASVLESKTKKQHRAKAGQENFSHNRQFDALITMVTRAECTLTLVNDDKLASRLQKNVIRHLSQLTATVSATVSEPPTEKPASSDKDWETRATIYLQSGHKDQALQMWVDILHRSEDSFIKFQTQGLAAEDVPLEKLIAAKKAPDSSPSIEKIKHPTITSVPASRLTGAPTASASKPGAEQGPKNSKAEAYVKSLVKVFNQQNLTTLLNHSSVIKLLFETPCGSHDYLLAYILSTPFCIPPFQTALEKHPREASKIISYVNAKSLTSGIETFFYFKQAALLEALVSNPMICHGVTAENLTALNGYMLHWLTFSNGLAILKKLLHHNPELYQGITAEALCFQRDLTAKEKAPISALMCLACSREGRGILITLLENNPQLCQDITAEALCLAHPEGTVTAFTSPLSWLAGSREGPAILIKLLNSNPRICQGITAEALCLARPKGTLDAFTSPLYWLSASHQGPAVLKILLDKNPQLCQGITAEALCLARHESAGKEAFTSPLYFFSGSYEGQEILNILLHKNPLLHKGITAEALCLACDKMGRGANSSLYWLSGSDEGLVILNTLVSNNPQLSQGITAEALCLMSAENDKNETYTTPLYWLSSSPEGLNLLAMLLHDNPQLSQGITAEALCMARPTSAGDYLTQSPLYWLSASNEGLQILKALLHGNPQLSQGITAEALCLALSTNTGEYRTQSPLYWLSTSSEALQILKTLLHDNPQLSQGITAEALCMPSPEGAEAPINESPLYLLTNFPESLAILKMILERNSGLLHAIEEKHLRRLVKKFPDDNENLTMESCWTNLMESAEGQKILQLLHKPPQAFSARLFQKKTEEERGPHPAPAGFHP